MRLSIIRQSLKQIWGIIILEKNYHGILPDINNYFSKTKYSLPFKGEWVVINGGVTEETSHSWEIPTQRYAYDFIVLDENSNSFSGNDTNPDSFYCYGKEILAPADGVVAEIYDECQNSKITVDRKAVCDADDIRGNYILIDHSNNEYSLMAHLKPGSICVTLGQPVKRGDKIAECGNTGNTSEPHLHFQLQLGKDFYKSPGLPVVFENIEVIETPNYEKFDGRYLRKNEKNFFPPYIEVGHTVKNI